MRSCAVRGERLRLTRDEAEKSLALEKLFAHSLAAEDVFLVLLFPSLFRFVLVRFSGLCNLLLEGGKAVIACGMHCARIGRFNATEKEVVFVAAVGAAKEARAVIGVWVVESE